MKTKGNVYLWLTCLFMLSACGSSKLTQEDKIANRQAIEAKDFKISVNRANPQGGKTVALNSAYSLQVRNDSVISHLPYYGRAYSVPFGGGDGLNFSAPIREYDMKYNNKGAAKIKLAARTNEDLYQFQIEIFENGTSLINVIMQNRQSISFSGYLDRRIRE